MTLEGGAGDDVESREYKVLRLDTHNALERALNEYTSQGWGFVSYQAAGDALAILHFLVLSRRGNEQEAPPQRG